MENRRFSHEAYLVGQPRRDPRKFGRKDRSERHRLASEAQLLLKQLELPLTTPERKEGE